MTSRRRTDQSAAADRRRSAVARRAADRLPTGMRFPSFQEQAVQFLTRYLFVALGLIFFNYATDFQPKWMPLWQINLLLGAHALINTANFIHAWMKPISPRRSRFALWMDIVAVTVCVANDPYDIPPSLVAYIVVVLGNGMRYGMRFFAEALFASLAGGSLAMVARYVHLQNVVSPGTIFLSLFGAIIVVYAYILMSRVERARSRTEQVSRTDALTGLLNRRGLSEAADGWLANTKWQERKPVVLFADLDNFKTVNDRNGHAEGDRVLAQVAATLQHCVRSTDLVARYGGDEFVLLLADASIIEAETIAARIQHGVGDWFADNDLACGISIGLAEVPTGEWSLTRVLQAVDRLLYEAKAERTMNGVRRVELA